MKNIKLLVLSATFFGTLSAVEAAPINFHGDSRINNINYTGDVVISADGLSFQIYETGYEFLTINFAQPANTVGITFDYSFTPVNYDTYESYFTSAMTASGSPEDSIIHYSWEGNLTGNATLLFGTGNTWHDVVWDYEHLGVLQDPSALVLTISNVDFAPVPLPAAVWLFGTGLVGLIGLARRKKTI